MSDYLTPAQTNFVWDQFRAGGHNGLSDAQVEALFDTIDRLRAERRVTKGLYARLDKQAADIRYLKAALAELRPAEVLVEGSFFAVADLPKILGNFMRSSNEHATEAKRLAIRLDALEGGQECPYCAQCDGSGEIPYADLDKRGRPVDITVECPVHALARIASNGDTK